MENRIQERMLTLEDPTLDRVRYVVHCGPGYAQWYKVEDDQHEYLPPNQNLPSP